MDYYNEDGTFLQDPCERGYNRLVLFYDKSGHVTDYDGNQLFSFVSLEDCLEQLEKFNESRRSQTIC